jgi:hypothetical protein
LHAVGGFAVGSGAFLNVCHDSPSLMTRSYNKGRQIAITDM